MALPTPDSLKNFGYAFQAQPFVNVPAKSSIILATMVYAYQAQPFVGNEAGPRAAYVSNLAAKMVAVGLI